MTFPRVLAALVAVLALAGVGDVAAASLAPAAAALGIARARHASYASTDVRTDAAPQIARSAAAVGASGAGRLVIDATFDESITSDPQAAAIEAAIGAAVGVFESLLDDPITVSIRFRYATTYADGTPLPGTELAVSETGVWVIPWSTFVPALHADGTSASDAAANVSLLGSTLSSIVHASSANARAVGLDRPPVLFADGSLGLGGTYDGIITLSRRYPMDFTRPPGAGTVDARRMLEHEIDEVLGLGSDVGLSAGVRPEDLFAWSAPGARNLTSSGTRYFSIDAGITGIVGLNQDPGGDFGDWLSEPCPQAHPYPQNAFSCPDQVADVTATSPEGIALDVIGYDLATPGSTTTTTSPASTTTTTLPAVCSSPLVECCPVGQPGCGRCGIDCGNGGCCPTTAPVCDNANGLCVACAPGQVECCPAGQPGCGLCGTDCGNGACCPTTAPVCDNANALCLATTPAGPSGPSGASGPECPSGQVACTDAALGFRDVACCAQPATSRDCAAACGGIVAACRASCATAPHAKKCRKRCRAAIVGRCRRSRPHACG
jgi:hypothetical protein